MRVWLSLTALITACGDGASDKDAEAVRAEDCQRVRDHLVDLRLAGSEVLGKIEIEKHRAILVSALGTQFLDNCTKTLSDQQVACLLAQMTRTTSTDATPPRAGTERYGANDAQHSKAG